jgi:hypothetical protein
LMNGYRKCAAYPGWTPSHKNEILSFAAAWIELGINMLS